MQDVHTENCCMSYSLILCCPKVTYWESPSCQRRPSLLQQQQLSQMSGVALARLQQMWSSADTRLHWPTRLCPDCYAHNPWHRLTW